MLVAENSLLTLVANLATTVQRRTLNGREYLVAPATLIVPGVLNGSDGPGYYPPEENARSASDWDGVPLVAYHPVRNGEPVAARDSDHEEWVWNNSGLGFLRRPGVNDGKMVAEAWFDRELTENYDRRLPDHVKIVPRLISNRPIELSTGLHLDRDETPGTCPKSGRRYDWVARNYRPDHLAVLPDQRGACSNEDGCGIVVNEEGEADYEEGTPAAAPTTPKGSKPVKPPKAVASGSAEAASRIEAQTSNAGKYGNPQHGDTGKYQKHGSGSGKGPNHAAAVAGHASPTTQDSVADNPPASEAEADGEEIERNCTATSLGMTTKNSDQQGDQTMGTATKLPPTERQGLIGKIVANCKCQDNERETLNKLSDATLMRLNAMADGGEGSATESEVEEENSPKKKLPPKFAKNQGAPTVNQAEIETSLAKSMGFADVNHMRATLNVAKKVEMEKRTELLTRISATKSTPDEKTVVWNKYKDKTISELEDIVDLILAPTSNREPDFFGGPPAPNFLGAAGGFEGVQRQAELPVFNTEADPEMDPQYWQRQFDTAGKS